MSCKSNSCGVPSSNVCLSKDGCVPGICPDVSIKRHDTKPIFRVQIEDCDGPIDLTDLVLEASMWAKGKLKKALTTDSAYFELADGIGFNQIMVGDVIFMDRPRLPEKMLVTGFDEVNNHVLVDRGYQGTTAQVWKKGTPLRIMKFVGASAKTEMIYQDIIQLDGSTLKDQLTDSFFIYEWQPTDTCLPGCYYMEFKLLKMSAESDYEAEEIPSLINSYGCGLGLGVEWIRRYPSEEGFIVQITDSPTSEF